jgi:hypothetical protein
MKKIKQVKYKEAIDGLSGQSQRDHPPMILNTMEQMMLDHQNPIWPQRIQLVWTAIPFTWICVAVVTAFWSRPTLNYFGPLENWNVLLRNGQAKTA